MKGCRFFLVFLVAAFLTVPALPAEAAFNPDRWENYTSIDKGETTRGYALVELTPVIYHLAAPDLRDLRVVRLEGGRIEEVPYDFVSSGLSTVKRYPVTVINQGVNNTKSNATVFLGENAGIHNNLEIQTRDRDFIKEVTIEGSNNNTDWVKLKSSDTIADVTASGDGFRKTGVTYSRTDYRYLRITLAGAGKPVHIDSVDILFKSEDSSTKRQLGLSTVRRETIEKEKSEALILTSGFDNLKLHSLVFSVDSDNFSREVTVFGSRDMKQWSFAGEGKLELLNLPRASQRALSVPVNSPGYRYLKVVIRNGDNPPLKISEIKAEFSPDYLLFPCEKAGSYRLYLSNSAAKAPDYDLAKLSQKIMTTRPPVWSVSNPQDNPSFKAEPVKVPESEKHEWLLPAILAVLVAVLAIFIIKSLPHITKNQ